MSRSYTREQRQEKHAQWNPRCAKTGKVRFQSHEAALLRAGELKLAANRAYLCSHCEGWHMTSRP